MSLGRLLAHVPTNTTEHVWIMWDGKVVRLVVGVEIHGRTEREHVIDLPIAALSELRIAFAFPRVSKRIPLTEGDALIVANNRVDRAAVLFLVGTQGAKRAVFLEASARRAFTAGIDHALAVADASTILRELVH